MLVQMSYDAERIDFIQEIFGHVGVQIARSLPVVVGFGHNRCGIPEPGDVEVLHVEHSERGWNTPAVVVHEFAHAWHASRWPDETRAATDVACETFAGLAEWLLAETHPKTRASVMDRHGQKPADIQARVEFYFENGVRDLTLDANAVRVLTSQV